MIRFADVVVVTPRITPVEARLLIIASWADDELPSPSPIRVQGQVVGPLCEYAATLSSQFPIGPFELPAASNLQAMVTILEPCFWEPAHPFCYDVELELYADDRLVDMRRTLVGVRHLAVEDGELLLNGRAIFLQGVASASADSFVELETWHEAGCDAFLADATHGMCERTDRWGPMLLHVVRSESELAEQVRQLRNRPSLLMWVLPAECAGTALHAAVDAIRRLDRSRPIGRMVRSDESARGVGDVDLLLLPERHPEIGNLGLRRPYLVVGGGGEGSDPATFAEQAAAFRHALGSPPGLVGLLV